MKRLLHTILLPAVLLFATDRLGGMLMRPAVSRSQDVLCPKLQYIQDSIREDIVLMGTSRCHHHYLPSIIADTLGASVYNAGVGGSGGIFSHYIMLCHILRRCTPGVICLDVAPTDHTVEASPLRAVNLFAPLFGKDDKADSVFRLAGTYIPYTLSHLYRYNARASSTLWGLLLNRQREADRGYMPLPQPKAFPTALRHEDTDSTVDTLKMKYLYRFIARCRQRNIELIFVASPKYTRVDSSYYAVLKAIAREHDIPFMDYHTRGLYLDRPELFKDVNHLWHEGAQPFSAVFAHDLKALLAARNR